MKNLFNLLYISFLALLTPVILAQTNDPLAEKILNNMYKNYSSMDNFKAHFQQKVVDVVDNKVLDSYKGEIIVSKNKYKIILDEQEIYNNGSKNWNYNKEFNEVYISDSKDKEDNALQNPARIYAIYKKDFKYFKVGEKKVKHQHCNIVDLIPINLKKVNYFKIKVFISKKTNVIISWQIFEKGNETRYDYSVTNFVKNNKLPKNYFNFDLKKHPKVEVID